MRSKEESTYTINKTTENKAKTRNKNIIKQCHVEHVLKFRPSPTLDQTSLVFYHPVPHVASRVALRRDRCRGAEGFPVELVGAAAVGDLAIAAVKAPRLKPRRSTDQGPEKRPPVVGSEGGTGGARMVWRVQSYLLLRRYDWRPRDPRGR